MEQGSKRYPVLKVPLDLSLAVDREVYDILKGFQSGVEAKHFVCSSILYYSRSPLVLSANALQERLDKIDFEKISYISLQLDRLFAKLDSTSVVRVCDKDELQEETVFAPSTSVIDVSTRSALTSLKEKFKI